MSDGDPIRLATTTPKDDIRQAAVGVLEELLVRARRGEIESLLVLYEATDYEGMQWYRPSSLSMSQTIGRIEIMKANLLRMLVEDL
jgi:hypothetical protein